MSTTDRWLTVALIVLGAVAYLVLLLGPRPEDWGPFFGTYIYNYYFLSILEGRADVPPRIVSIEGHYTEDGRAFVYYGLAPVLFRFFAWPFVDLTSVPIGPFVVWFCGVGGTALYHWTFARIVMTSGLATVRRRYWLILIGVMIWVAAPGIYVSINYAVYQEPIAIAYLASAVFVTQLARVVRGEAEVRHVIIYLALAAALTVHARPHVAVGLYAGIVLLLGWQHLRKGFDGLGLSVLALAIMGGSGVALLGWNAFRFGDAMMMHGSLQGGALQHGVSFWGVDGQPPERAQAFVDHGRFNVGRILPNAFLYTFDLAELTPWVRETWEAWKAHLGFMRVEVPHVGLIYLWTPWFILILGGLMTAIRGTRGAWILLAATGLAAAMMLAYPTLTHRYRTDLWPVFAAVAILVLPGLLRMSAARTVKSDLMRASVSLALVLSVFFSILTVQIYRIALVESRLYFVWSQDLCEELAGNRGFPQSQVDRMCAL